MRSMLEDITQAIYLNKQMGESNTSTKLQKLSKLKEQYWGFHNFRGKIDPPDFLTKRMISLNKELNQYVHPSTEPIMREVESLRIARDCLPKEFDESSRRHIETCDVVVALVFCRFSKALECFLTHDGAADDYIQDLRKRGFTCTSLICEEPPVWCANLDSSLQTAD